MYYNIIGFVVQIVVKKDWIQSNNVEFPAVTVCNTNPIKNSLLHLSPRISALFDGGTSRFKRSLPDIETKTRSKKIKKGGAGKGNKKKTNGTKKDTVMSKKNGKETRKNEGIGKHGRQKRRK